MTGSSTTSPAQTTGGSSTTKAHWSLDTPIDIAKITPFYGKLGIKLSTDNYVAWARVAETSLRTVKLFEYCLGTVAMPTDAGDEIYWRQVDLVVQGIILSNMEPEIISQLDPGLTAAELWSETKRLYAGETMADYTLTFSNLINMKFSGDDNDVIEHILRMKGFRRDLILMGRDIPDEVFACCLRLSMPQEWNYVFAGLLDPYTSKQVEA
jgi:hypothetical protein